MNSEYKDIQTLISNLNKASESLENGTLSVNDISVMLGEARELHERIAILQFQIGQPKVTALKEELNTSVDTNAKKGELNFSFDFTSQTEEEQELSNQTNLLDAIEEQPEIEQDTIQVEPVEQVSSERVEQVNMIEQENDKEEATINDLAQTRQTSSINDKFANITEQETLAERLGKSRIASLPEAIGLNQKFLFMNDLFEGENGLYKEAIQTLDNFTSFIDADEFLNTLIARHNWDSTSKTTKDFMELVERRYS